MVRIESVGARDMITLICGGRNFGDYKKFNEAMATLSFTPSVVVQGGARGADLLAKMWAKENNIHMAEVCALWNNGRNAGFDRNSVMLSLGVQYVIAFPGGNGTADTVKKARAMGLPVWLPYG